MQPISLKNSPGEGAWLEMHPVSPEDSVAAAALRSAVARLKGKFDGPSPEVRQRCAAP
jgi:hypothetical protein